MAAGDFTAGEICEVVVRQDQIWANPQEAAEYRSNVETLTAIREQQTARWDDQTFNFKTKKIKMLWLKDCDIAVEDCVRECDLDGDEIESSSQELHVDLCKQATFKVKIDGYQNNVFGPEELAARGALKAKKVLDEWLVQQTIAKLATFGGTNEVSDNALYPAAGGMQTYAGITNIDDSLWTADLFAYFAMVQAVNEMALPYMIHGTNFFALMHNAALNLAVLDQKDNATKFAIFKQYWDMKNFAVTNHTKDTFFIDKAAVAFQAINEYAKNATPQQKAADVFHYTDQSKALPGIYYDVIKQRTCESGDYFDTYKYTVNAGVFNNPARCSAGRTGVLQFRQGNTVT